MVTRSRRKGQKKGKAKSQEVEEAPQQVEETRHEDSAKEDIAQEGTSQSDEGRSETRQDDLIRKTDKDGNSDTEMVEKEDSGIGEKKEINEQEQKDIDHGEKEKSKAEEKREVELLEKKSEDTKVVELENQDEPGATEAKSVSVTSGGTNDGPEVEDMEESAGTQPEPVNNDVVNMEENQVMENEQLKETKAKKKRRRKKKRDIQQKKTTSIDVRDHRDEPEIEYIPEKIDLPRWDVNYAAFSKIFEAFKLSDTVQNTSVKEEVKKEETTRAKKVEEKDPILDEDDLEKEQEPEEPKLSKKKLKLLNRLSVAELKQLVHRPDVVEMHDVNAKDPRLLVYLKAYRNTVPVPRHWCFKRKYLQGKRGFVKPPFELPEFIRNTGIMEMRAAMQEKEDQKTMKAKQRAKVRPKLGKIDIDYQKLHDAFFKYQTKPKMTIHGDLYYEGKEFETKLKEKKPGDLSDELRTALGMPIGPGKHLIPPPWLIAMQRYGPPPSYPNLKIPGLNAPIPEGASFGYHAGGWGKPPVDEEGKPLYGDVFGSQQQEVVTIAEEEDVDRTQWGELESEESSSEEEEEEEEEEDRTGLITPADAGLVTPSGLTSIPAGMETPDMIELRKRKEIEDAMEAGSETPSLYTLVPEKRAAVGGAMMGSSHVYDLAAGAGRKGTGITTPAGEGVEIALDPSELELDPAAMSAKYEETMKEREAFKDKEDLSDMVAEHVAKKKRKKPTESGKAAKKYKEFKF